MARNRKGEHRDAAAAVAQDITAQNEPVIAQRPAPEVVEEPVAAQPDKTGKVAIIIGTFVLLAGIVGLGITVLVVRNRVPVKIESVTELVDDTTGCEWQLTIKLYNNSDEPLQVARIGAILNQRSRSGTLEQSPPLLAPGRTGTHHVRFRLPPADVCPAVDEINHGNLIFHLVGGSSESLRF